MDSDYCYAQTIRCALSDLFLLELELTMVSSRLFQTIKGGIQTVALLAGLSVGGCIDDSKPPHPAAVAQIAATSDISVAGQRTGSTPFIAYVDLAGSSTQSVAAIAYTIAPMAGTASAPVRVSFTMTSLRNRGYVTATGLTVPIFGLYANATNTASVRVTFSDNSFRLLSVPIVTPAYTASSGLKSPQIERPRQPGSALGFDFLAIKPAGLPAKPVTVIDTDGNIRWVSTTPARDAVQLINDGFVIGDISGKSFSTERWDGKVTRVNLADQTFNLFHHELSIGPVGYFIAPDTDNRTEDLLLEVRPDGSTAKTFDLVQIFSDFMQAHGDDPTLFARPGLDWFHLNSQVYDPTDRSVIVSSRENFLVKLDYDTGAIKWIFGDETKYWYTFPSLRSKALMLAPGGLAPIGQHALSIQPDGQLLMFNNGRGSNNNPTGTSAGVTRTYSATTSYFIDGPSLTATPGFSFDDGQSVYSPSCSSTYASADRSMLITYSTSPSGVRIKGLDPLRRVVFDIHYSGSCATGWNSVIVPLQNLVFTD